MLSYLDAGGQEIARVHQYLLPDGGIGGSGRPDPKRLYHNEVLYHLQQAPPPPPVFDDGGSLRWLTSLYRRLRCFLFRK